MLIRDFGKNVKLRKLLPIIVVLILVLVAIGIHLTGNPNPVLCSKALEDGVLTIVGFALFAGLGLVMLFISDDDLGFLISLVLLIVALGNLLQSPGIIQRILYYC